MDIDKKLLRDTQDTLGVDSKEKKGVDSKAQKGVDTKYAIVPDSKGKKGADTIEIKEKSISEQSTRNDTKYQSTSITSKSSQNIEELLKIDKEEFYNKSKMKVDDTILGRGGFSVVLVGRTAEGRGYAVKFILLNPKNKDDEKISDEDFENKRKKNILMAKTESIISNNLRNKNCIRSYGYFELKHSRALILDLAVNKDLNCFSSLLYSQRLFVSNINKDGLLDEKNLNKANIKNKNIAYSWFFTMSENLIKFFFLQILNALDYLRKMNFIHKDLKLENYLLLRDFSLKVSDFALSENVPLLGDVVISTSGTVIYMSPECLSTATRQVSVRNVFKIDMYSAGVSLFKLFFNTFLVVDKKESNYDKKMYHKELLDTLEKMRREKEQFFYNLRDSRTLSKEAITLIYRMIDPEIKRRADITEVLKSPWVNINVEFIRYTREICDHNDFYFKSVIELQKSNYISYSEKCNSKLLECVKITPQNTKKDKLIKMQEIKFRTTKHKKRILF